jgi:hypothetical protein
MFWYDPQTNSTPCKEAHVFLGWYDPDKKTPARFKLEDALERYARKFGRPALTCLTSPEDAAELEADKQAPEMPVRGAGFIPRYTFYVGIDEEQEEVVRPATRNRPAAEERKAAVRKIPTSDASQLEKRAALSNPAAKRPAAKNTPVPKAEPKTTQVPKSAAKGAKAPAPKRTVKTRK